jgi:hypothetical protein
MRKIIEKSNENNDKNISFVTLNNPFKKGLHYHCKDTAIMQENYQR